jgi:predicted transcriptional regulator
MTITRSRRVGGEKERIRLSLDVSPELNELIEDLAGRTDGTKSDVLRRAIALMDVAVRANESGKRVGVADTDQGLTTEFVGLGVRRVSSRTNADFEAPNESGMPASV